MLIIKSYEYGNDYLKRRKLKQRTGWLKFIVIISIDLEKLKIHLWNLNFSECKVKTFVHDCTVADYLNGHFQFPSNYEKISHQ